MSNQAVKVLRSRHVFVCAGVLVAMACNDSTGPRQLAKTGVTQSVQEDAAASAGVAVANTWVSLHELPARREAGMVAATFGGVVYAVGGQYHSTSDFVITNTLLAYNIGTNSWSFRKPLPIHNTWMNGASVINGLIYVGGGYGQKRLYVYNPAADTWVRKADMPNSGAYGAQGVIDERLYVYTGDPSAFYRYNPTTNIWTKLRAPTHIHMLGAGGAINGKFYLAAGFDDGLRSRAVEAYDPATDTWSPKASVPAPAREKTAGAVVNGKLYVAGGETDTGVLGSLVVYDPAANAWSTKAPMATKRYGATAVRMDGGRLLVLGGDNAPGDAARVVESYTP